MPKSVLITGSTDGIGLEAAKMLAAQGHTVLLHGRNRSKLEDAEKTLSALRDVGRVESYVADLSRMADVETLAQGVAERHGKLDVLINNAGIYSPCSTTDDGLDVRFAVNTLAPYSVRHLPQHLASDGTGRPCRTIANPLQGGCTAPAGRLHREHERPDLPPIPTPGRLRK